MDRDDVIDVLKFLAPIVLGVVVIFSVVCGLVIVFNYNTCQTYAGMGIDVQFHFWGGCFANHPKFGWVPVNEYFRILNVNVP
jgi:hypothetical protein